MLGSKRRLGIAALLVLALVAAACGSSSKKSSSGGGATSTTASAAKPSGAPIKLGVLTSITGPSVHFAEVPAGAQAAANAINAAEAGVNYELNKISKDTTAADQYNGTRGAHSETGLSSISSAEYSRFDGCSRNCQ